MAWFNKIEDDPSNIAEAIEYYNNELEHTRAECKIFGSLEKASSTLPGIVDYRFKQLQEIEAILESLNIKLRKERSILFRQFVTAEHSISSRDAEKYVDGEESVYNLSMLINRFALVRNKYLGVMKALDVKQWQIGHITKLRTAGMEDITIDH